MRRPCACPPPPPRTASSSRANAATAADTAEATAADGKAYAVRVDAESRAAGNGAVAEAERDRALLEAEGARSKLQAEADGYLELLKAYDTNPQLAQFIKGNESGLWAFDGTKIATVRIVPVCARSRGFRAFSFPLAEVQITVRVLEYVRLLPASR